MPGKRYVDMLLDDLRPAEPLDSEARRDLHGLAERYSKVRDGVFIDNITTELVYTDRQPKPPPTPIPGPGRLLYQAEPFPFHWEEVLGMLVGAVTLLALLI